MTPIRSLARRSSWMSAGALAGVIGLCAIAGCAAEAQVTAGPPPPVAPPPVVAAPPPAPVYAPPPAGPLPTPPQLIPSPAARASHPLIGGAFNAYLVGDWFGALRIATQMQGFRPFLAFQLKTMTYCQLRDPVRARNNFGLFNSVAPTPNHNWRRAAMAQLCAQAGIGL
jgi:hypothetical protein